MQHVLNSSGGSIVLYVGEKRSRGAVHLRCIRCMASKPAERYHGHRAEVIGIPVRTTLEFCTVDYIQPQIGIGGVGNCIQNQSADVQDYSRFTGVPLVM